MSQKHYDIAILGESLAARVTAALLVRRGRRVVFFREPAAPPTHWLFSSMHLRQLLQTLGGRSCAIAPQPLQVLTTDIRWEINGKIPLEEELRREFPAQNEAVGKLLSHLSHTGERLEMTLWKSRGSILAGSTLKANLRMKGLAAALKNPLSTLISSQTSGQASKALETLFSGISGQPIEKLSVAEGALLWNWVTSPEGVSPSGLEELLRYRLEQFHGESVALSDIKEIHHEGKKITEAVLKNGSRYSADYFVLGSAGGWNILPAPFPHQTLENVEGRFLSTPIDKISPMLARRVILNQELPLRLEFSGPDAPSCRVEVLQNAQGQGQEPKTPEFVKEQLGMILPFAQYSLAGQQGFTANSPTGFRPFFSRVLNGMLNPIRLKGNLLLAQGSAVWPSLGASGEILVGFSVANWLEKGQKKAL